MSNPRGPVVVGMDISDGTSAGALAAIDVAAREAMRRQVELRLVYGLAALPPWIITTQLLDEVVTRATEAYPALAITTGIYPGTPTQALVTASVSASLVVIGSGTGTDDGVVVADLVSNPRLNAPVVMVLASAADNVHHDEPVLIFS